MGDIANEGHSGISAIATNHIDRPLAVSGTLTCILPDRDQLVLPEDVTRVDLGIGIYVHVPSKEAHSSPTPMQAYLPSHHHRDGICSDPVDLCLVLVVHPMRYVMGDLDIEVDEGSPGNALRPIAATLALRLVLTWVDTDMATVLEPDLLALHLDCDTAVITLQP